MLVARRTELWKWPCETRSPLSSALPAQERALHAGPVIKAASADLDVGKDSFRFPITQGPTADWQPRQQSLLVNESRLG